MKSMMALEAEKESFYKKGEPAMAEEGVNNEQIDRFLSQVASLREGSIVKEVRSADITDRASRNIGLVSV